MSKADKQFKKFRTILESAIDEDLHTKNFFKKIKLSNKSPEGDNLSPFQVQLLFKSDNLLTPTLILYKDIFLWSVYTGMSYQDAATLEKIKITKESDTEYRLKSRRGKTNEFYDQYLPKLAIQLMQKYENHPEITAVGGVIPNRSNKEVNEQLKIITNLLNLPFELKTHVARRTFRQLIGEAGVVTDGIIKKLMGHSNQNIDSRYYKVNENPLLVAKKLFDIFVQEKIE